MWGTFAFPWMYRAEFFRAIGIPLAALIAATLLWQTGEYGVVPGFPRGVSYALYLLAFSWLAVRCHRLVLLGPDAAAPPASASKSIAAYVATMAGMWVVGVFLILLTVSIVLLIFGTRYVPAGSAPTGVRSGRAGRNRPHHAGSHRHRPVFRRATGLMLPAIALADSRWDLLCRMADDRAAMDGACCHGFSVALGF